MISIIFKILINITYSHNHDIELMQRINLSLQKINLFTAAITGLEVRLQFARIILAA